MIPDPGNVADGRISPDAAYDVRQAANGNRVHSPDRETRTILHGRMSVNLEHDDGGLRIMRTVRPPGLRLDGEIDDDTYPVLIAALDTVAVDCRHEDVHLDLSLVRFCDVAGLRAMVRLAERLDDGRRVVLHAPAPSLRTVLRVVGWDDVHGLILEEG